MANTISEFQFDVFLSYSAKDKAVVQPLAERLRQDGTNVWPIPPKPPRVGGFDEFLLAPGDNIPAKIEKGSAHSNILGNEGCQMCGCVELTPFLADPELRRRPPHWDCPQSGRL
jgi:hypothetical protein